MQILDTPIRYRARVRDPQLAALGLAKADALTTWYAADGAIAATERLLFAYATPFRDNAAWVSGEVKRLRDEFDARFAEVQDYGEWTTRWGKYQQEGRDWETRANGLLAQMNAVLLQLPEPPPPEPGSPPPRDTPPRTQEPKKDNTLLWVAGGVAVGLVLLGIAASSRKK
jgi:hypothetical protein